MQVTNQDLVVFKGRYKALKKLGNGNFGEVWLFEAIHQPTQPQYKYLAVKFVPSGPGLTPHLRREASHHAKLVHPNIIQYEGVDAVAGHIAIAMEFAGGGDLLSHINQEQLAFTEATCRHVFRQVVSGVDYMHQRGLCNRDIKLDNILVSFNESDDLCIKICDLGLCKSDLSSAAKSLVGTIGYMAPEIRVLEDRQTSIPYDGKKADVFSCGCLLFAMQFKQYLQTPAPKQSIHWSDPRAYKVGLPEVGTEINGSMMTADLRDLLKKMLVGDPDKRLSLAGVATHPWVGGCTQGLHIMRSNDQLIQAQNQNPAARPPVPSNDLLQSIVGCAGVLAQAMRANDMVHQAQA